PWEAVLTPQRQVSGQGGPGRPLQFFRQGKPLPGPSEVAPQSSALVVAVVGRSWQQAVESGWRPPERWRPFFAMRAGAEPRRQGPVQMAEAPTLTAAVGSLGDVQVLHLIGRPISTPSGWQLRVDSPAEPSPKSPGSAGGEVTAVPGDAPAYRRA